MSNYKIIVKYPKSDNDRKIEGLISFIELGPKIIVDSILNNLPNPFTDSRTNLPVENNTGSLSYKSSPVIKPIPKSELADDAIRNLELMIIDKYGVSIELKYEDIIIQPTQNESVETPLSSNNLTTESTSSESREYTFDVKIKDTFYNSDIGYLTITSKLDDIFVYGGDIQDTIDSEYIDSEFAGSEEDKLLLSTIEQFYSPEEISNLPPEEIKIMKDNIKKANKLNKPLKNPPNDLIIAMRKYGIVDKLERAHFLAQCGHESGDYIYKEELASGRAYEGRKDLGNTMPGDGPKYKGRGYIQVTGRANYEKYSNYLVSKGLDNVINSPELVASKYSADAACYWWKFLSRNITKIALEGTSKQNVVAVTKRVNGGQNGLEDRNERFNKYLSEIQQDGAKYA